MPWSPTSWFSTVRLTVLAAMIILCFRAPGPWDAQRILGNVLILIGAIGIAIAPHQLGSFFSITPKPAVWLHKASTPKSAIQFTSSDLSSLPACGSPYIAAIFGSSSPSPWSCNLFAPAAKRRF